MKDGKLVVGTHLDELKVTGKNFISPCYGYPKYRFVIAPNKSFTNCLFLIYMILEIDFENGSSVEAYIHDCNVITTPDLKAPPIEMFLDLARTSTNRFNKVINNSVVPKTASHLSDFINPLQGDWYVQLISQELKEAYASPPDHKRIP